MTCDHAIELQPWLLNGTLATEERDEVWKHLETCESCRQALAETREAWSMFAQHLPSQDLVALAWGEAPSEAVEEHLASCAPCAAELELARMSRRLEEEGNIALFPAAKPRPAAAPRKWQAVAMAASLLMAVSAFGWVQASRQAGDLSNRLARLEAPAGQPEQPAAGETPSLREQVARLEGEMKHLVGLQQENEKQFETARSQVAQLEKERAVLAGPHAAEVVDLGAGDVVRGETAEQPLHGDQYITLLLPARGAKSGERQAEILDGSGKVVRQVGRLPVTQDFHSIVLPPGSLSPGVYTLRLSGREETWTLRVVR